VIALASGWDHSLQWHGYNYTRNVTLINAILITGVWLLLILAALRPSRPSIFVLHWLFVAWLVWQAFPWQGELL